MTDTAQTDRFPGRLFSRVRGLGNLGLGTCSRVFALGSQFVVLILLGSLLEKTDFGDFMIAFALMRLLSQGLGTGLATLLIYHVSRDAAVDRQHALHRTAMMAGLLVAGGAALSLALGADAIAGAFNKPSLTFWLRGLALFLTFSTLLTISTGLYDGRGEITRSILMSEFAPNLIRLILLPMQFALLPGNMAVVIVMTLSVMLPWTIMLPHLFGARAAGFARLTRWDACYSSKLTLHSFAAMQMQGIDMLVVGWLFSSVFSADYALASRVAALVPFFQQIIVKGFMAKAGRAIHVGDHILLQEEVSRSRRNCVLLVTATAVAALIGYPLLLHMQLGGFAGSQPLLAALVLAPVIRSYFPGADALLRIAGFANNSLGIMLASAALLIVTPLLLAPVVGIYSIAIGMFLSAILLNPLIVRIVRRKLGVHLVDASAMIGVPIAIIGTLACIFAQDWVAWGGGALLLALSAFPVTHSTLRKRKV